MPVIEKLDKALALKLMSEAVAERGEDFIYKQEHGAQECRYVHDTESYDPISGVHEVVHESEDWSPGCLVGAALVKGGVSMKQIVDTGSNEDGSDLLLDRLINAGVIGKVTDGAVAVIARAQSLQDRGDSWGYALDRAKASTQA
jgi:hypothetical protein